jgi:hypothetical protein
MQGIEHEARPPGGAAEPTQAPVAERPVWKRSHIIWFLVALSLVPGVVAAAFPEEWGALAPGVRMTAYVVSGILIAASCALMLREDPGQPAARAGGHTSGDSP